MIIDRRHFLQLGIGSGLLTSPMARLALAKSPGDTRFVFVILRGGMDGLAAVPAYGDNNYYRLRGGLALPTPASNNGVLDLDGFFGLHPSLKNLYALYKQGEALVIHAVASPYRERSHFDGQKLLENGTNHPLGANDGWLNRALSEIPGNRKGYAIALAQKIPLVLYGSQVVNAWAPAVLPDIGTATLARVTRMYEQDEFFSSQLQSALQTREIADGISMENNHKMGRRRGGQLVTYVKAAGKFLKDPDGPRIAVLEMSGWDTHANQGNSNGQLANQFNSLDEAINILKNTLGNDWKDTVITIVTEFGRTVAVNGSNGTDHGTASAAFLVGGSVNGGKVLTDWPGLSKSNLYEGRDISPTMDIRRLFKTVLHERMKVSLASLNKNIFPDSTKATLIHGLFLG